MKRNKKGDYIVKKNKVVTMGFQSLVTLKLVYRRDVLRTTPLIYKLKIVLVPSYINDFLTVISKPYPFFLTLTPPFQYRPSSP